ncbi:MAG: tetratricopeptide repeat protein [Gammaproteobacteria bacterium]
MDVYTTEQEQVEALKKWWRENATALIVGAAIGLGGLFGWQYWQRHIDERGAAAAVEYEALMLAAQTGQHDTAVEKGQKLINEYGDTPYAAMGRLLLAKVYVEQGDLAAAKAQLQAAMNEADSDETRHVARLRLGKVLLALEEYDALKSLIEGVDPGAFTAAYAELRGDLLVATGDKAGARAAYQEALEAGSASASFIQLKLDDLGDAMDETAR